MLRRQSREIYPYSLPEIEKSEQLSRLVTHLATRRVCHFVEEETHEG